MGLYIFLERLSLEREQRFPVRVLVLNLGLLEIIQDLLLDQPLDLIIHYHQETQLQSQELMVHPQGLSLGIKLLALPPLTAPMKP